MAVRLELFPPDCGGAVLQGLCHDPCLGCCWEGSSLGRGAKCPGLETRGASPLKWGCPDMTAVPCPPSSGEGCIALRLEATETQLPIYTPLTHHGEMMGHFRGEIKLQTSQGKTREKLYGKWAAPPSAPRGWGQEWNVLSAMASDQNPASEGISETAWPNP